MEKISGILPSNARLTTVDLSSSGTARPGAQLLGRQPGKSALAGDDDKTTAMKAMNAHRSLVEARTVDQQRAEIAQKIADGFFVKHKNIAEQEIGVANSPGQAMAVAGANDTQDYRPLDQVELSREDDLDAPEVGRYIDVVA